MCMTGEGTYMCQGAHEEVRGQTEGQFSPSTTDSGYGTQVRVVSLVSLSQSHLTGPEFKQPAHG